MRDPRPSLEEIGLSLPEPFAGAGSYVPAVRSDNMLFMAGHIPLGGDEIFHTGRLGEDLSVDDGIAAARACATSLIATLLNELGDSEEVGQILRICGYVNATSDFVDHTTVVNGASDVLVAVFGDRGKHARAAVGMSSLPVNMAVEIEAIVRVDPA